MIVLYSNIIGPRLQYICRFIFEQQLRLSFQLTNDRSVFINSKAFKLNYSYEPLPEADWQLRPHKLLFENDIKPQDCDCFLLNQRKAFFKNGATDFPFDILAASFYLISRYEEYLPHSKDSYGRYAHENSLAWKNNFLDQPLVNFWIFDFARLLIEKGLKDPIQFPEFKTEISYDIDIAWSYCYKGIKRNLGGLIRKPSLNRLLVLSGLKKDPFDCYDYLQEIHRRKNIRAIYFFLVAEKNGEYDKQILPSTRAMQALIRKHADLYETGLHPSWQSHSDPTIFEQEKKILESITGKAVTRSRQHYIWFTLPTHYEWLIYAGINDDYSMGYGSINGFRASTASVFHWYNLAAERETNLLVHPFCYMDANCFYEQKLNTKESYDELMKYLKLCKQANGVFSCIFHNHFLGDDPMFKGWRELHQQITSLLPQ